MLLAPGFIVAFAARGAEGELGEPVERVPEPPEMSWACQGSAEGCRGTTGVKQPAVWNQSSVKAACTN